MGPQYTRIMAKITRPQRAKPAPVRSPAKKAAKAAPKTAPKTAAKAPKTAANAKTVPKTPARAVKKALKAAKPWTPAEIREAFSRFAASNP